MRARACWSALTTTLLTLATFCLFGLVPALAEAAPERYGVVTVDLRPEQGAEVPTHLCVLSMARGPRARSSLRSSSVDDSLGA